MEKPPSDFAWPAGVEIWEEYIAGSVGGRLMRYKIFVTKFSAEDERKRMAFAAIDLAWTDDLKL
jgi:hypothetical protein